MHPGDPDAKHRKAFYMSLITHLGMLYRRADKNSDFGSRAHAKEIAGDIILSGIHDFGEEFGNSLRTAFFAKKTSASKQCTSGKVRNAATGRCVLKAGRVGRKLTR